MSSLPIAAQAQSYELSDSQHLANAIVEGYVLESQRPIKEALEDPNLKILMQAKLAALNFAPFLGFVNGWQITDLHNGVRGHTGGGLAGSYNREMRRGAEKGVLRNGGNSSMFAKYGYVDREGQFQINFQSNYGPVLLEFRNEIRPRITKAYGDSADQALGISPLRVQPTSEELESKVIYIEGQIWGDLWLNDVKTLYLPEEALQDYEKRVVEMSKWFGFGVKVIRWHKSGSNNKIEILRTLREPQARQGANKMARMEDFRRHVESLDAERRASWAHVFGQISFNLPKNIRMQALEIFPEALAGYEKAKNDHFASLRRQILDKEFPLLGRLESLKQWVNANGSIDFALYEPIKEILHNEKAALYSKMLGMNFTTFDLPSSPKPIIPVDMVEIQHRIIQESRIHKDEIEYLKRILNENLTPFIFQFLSAQDPKLVYQDAFLTAAFQNSYLRSDKPVNPNHRTPVVSAFESEILIRMAENPPTLEEAERLDHFIAVNPKSLLSLRVAILLKHFAPSIISDERLATLFKSWAYAQNYKEKNFPVYELDLNKELAWAFAGSDDSPASELKLKMAYLHFLQIMPKDLLRVRPETIESYSATITRLRASQAKSCRAILSGK